MTAREAAESLLTMNKQTRAGVIALIALYASARIAATLADQRTVLSYYNGRLDGMSRELRDRVQIFEYIYGMSDELPESMGGPKR